MEILYSDILPLSIQDGQKSILDAFREQLIASDSFEFAVGYVSKASLEEIDNLVSEYGITHVSLVIGMYYIEGMPESTYRTALAINEKWKASGIGEIRLVKAFKYHGKLYAFLKGGVVFSAIIGSANLGVIKPEANNRRQYEVSALIRGTDETEEILSHIRELQSDRCSINIADVHDMTLIREINVSLTGVDTVERVPQTEVALYDRHKTGVSFVLPIKVPAYDERHMDDGKHFTKSNLNVSYAAPRSARKSRDWYETQFTVSKSIRFFRVILKRIKLSLLSLTTVILSKLIPQVTAINNSAQSVMS